MEDDKIIGLIKTGKSDSALTALYHHYPAIRKMIAAKGGSRQEAEDIFQEALIILLRKVTHTHFLLTAPLSAYITGICRLLWKGEMKKKQLPATYTEEYADDIAEQALQQLKEWKLTGSWDIVRKWQCGLLHQADAGAAVQEDGAGKGIPLLLVILAGAILTVMQLNW